jgi:Subtilase family
MQTIIRLITLVLVLLSGSALAIDPVRSAQACLDWRRVGIMAPGIASCAALNASGWQTQTLFDLVDVAPGSALTRYCRFENVTGNAQMSVLNALVNNQKLVALDRDCVAIAPLADPASLSTIQWSALAAQLHEQSGLNALGANTLLGSSAVRLAVLDGNPTNASDPELQMGTAPHGNALITMAQNLLCGSAPYCPVNVTSQLALTFLRVDPLLRTPEHRNQSQGGHLASISELAAALHREVSAWRLAAANDRLVLNLSLGWDGDFGGNEPVVTQMSAPVQAMYAALSEASCYGALVFAAAGNRSGGTDPEIGPMLPGAWEQRAAPTRTECQQRLGLNPPQSQFLGSNYRPLLYAVSGIEGDGSVLDNARSGANARLAAYGDHAVIESQARVAGEPTATLTGSSVATLLASANAAVAWSWQPGANAQQIVDALYNASTGTASALPRAADFCFGNANAGLCSGGANPQSRRLSLCLTRWAMGGSTLTPSACAWNMSNPALALDYSAFDNGATTFNLTTLDQTQIVAACGNAIVHFNSTRGIPAIPCPHLTLPSIGARPWVLPQPGTDLCPQCEDGGRGAAKQIAGAKTTELRVLRLQITPRLVGTITDAVLISGNHLYMLDFGRALQPGDRVLIQDLETITGNRDQAMIAFAVDSQIAAISTVLVAQ